MCFQLFSIFGLILGDIFHGSIATQMICTNHELIGIIRAGMHQYGHSPAAAATQMAKDANKHYGGHWSVVILGPHDHSTSSFSLPSSNFCESIQGGHYIAMSGFIDERRTTSTAKPSETNVTSPGTSDSREPESAASMERTSRVGGLSPILLAVIIALLLLGIANVVAICFLRRRRRHCAAFQESEMGVAHYESPVPTVQLESLSEVECGPPTVPPRPAGIHATTRILPLGKAASEMDNKL